MQAGMAWPGDFAGLRGWRRGCIGQTRKYDVDGPSDPNCGHVQRMLFPPRPRHAATSSVASRCARGAATTPHSLSHCPMIVRATPHTPVPVPRTRAGLQRNRAHRRSSWLAHSAAPSSQKLSRCGASLHAQASDVSTTIRTLQALAADPQLFKSKSAGNPNPIRVDRFKRKADRGVARIA
jgi:hypothetical protein